MEFIITRCDTCNNIDGSIQVTPTYDCSRDLKEWSKEGRLFTTINTEKQKFPTWCMCHNDKEDE